MYLLDIKHRYNSMGICLKEVIRQGSAILTISGGSQLSSLNFIRLQQKEGTEWGK